MYKNNENNNLLNSLNPKTHYMNLYPDSFKAIKNGIKKVEMRLKDEKRRKINQNDFIEFQNIETNEIILTKVINIKHFLNFVDLYNYYDDKRILGYNDTETADPNDMLLYYSQEKINSYGVIAIEIVLI